MRDIQWIRMKRGGPAQGLRSQRADGLSRAQRHHYREGASAPRCPDRTLRLTSPHPLPEL